MTETTGHRLYLIRLACGDGVRKAEPLEAFAARVKRQTKAVYDPSTISLLERMKQNWRLDDAEAFAAVDPLRRGVGWLAFNLPPEAVPEESTEDAPTRRAKGKAS